MRLRRRCKSKTTPRRAAAHWDFIEIAHGGNTTGVKKSDEITLLEGSDYKFVFDAMAQNHQSGLHKVEGVGLAGGRTGSAPKIRPAQACAGGSAAAGNDADGGANRPAAALRQLEEPAEPPLPAPQSRSERQRGVTKVQFDPFSAFSPNQIHFFFKAAGNGQRSLRKTKSERP